MLGFIRQQEGGENEASKKFPSTDSLRFSDWFSIWLDVFSWVLYKNRDELEKISNQKHV